MIKLVKNEFIKFSKLKIIICSLIVVGIINIIVYLNNGKNVMIIKDTVFSLVPFIGIMICILCGGIVSNEFQSGTIRMYLTKPYKRWKILLSKLIFIFLLIIYYYFIVCFSYTMFIIIYKSYFVELKYLCEIFIHFIPVFFMGCLSFMFSTVFNNTTFSVGVSILLYLACPIISQVLFGLDYSIMEYTFLPYIDYSIFKDNDFMLVMKNELGADLNLKKSSIILLVYSVIFVILSFNVFIKKDIKN